MRFNMFKIPTLLLMIFAMPSIGITAAFNIQPVSQPSITRMQGKVQVLRNHHYIQASQGFALKHGDEVYTGRRGKAYIDFPDNSRVKLGANARFVVDGWEEKRGVFSTTLRILQGAFRYTAGLIHGFDARRTTVMTKTAVLGVRGTDFWGRVESEQTFLLLLEGEVSLSPVHGEKIIYNQALHAVNIDNNSISKPKALDMKTIAPLAAETEIK